MRPSLDSFRRVLAAHLGRELTPEAAAEIERAAGLQPDAPIDIWRFEPARHDRYVICLERFTDAIGELHALHVAHWRETEAHRHGLPLNPDYDGMAEHERAGRLLQFTVRRDGALVGNLRLYVGVSAHSGTPFAVFPTRTNDPASEEDTLYLAPEHRGGFLAMHLLRYAERVLVALGMREIRADSKLINRADVLMRRMGYRPFALKFVKVIGAQEESNVPR